MRSRKNPRRNWNTKREGKRGKAKKSWARKGEDKTEKQESNLQMPGLLMTVLHVQTPKRTTGVSFS
jgi:hypothetical protein